MVLHLKVLLFPNIKGELSFFAIPSCISPLTRVGPRTPQRRLLRSEGPGRSGRGQGRTANGAKQLKIKIF